MLKLFKNFFHNPDRETIKIFEEKIKIDYDPTLFLSLKVLSLTDSKLKNLNPLLVFVNLEILNLSNNRIKDINSLKNLKNLKIIDLRFNKIEKIPLWLFDYEDNIYWKRENEEKKGIYLEGNPLDKELIDRIKNHHQRKRLLSPPKIQIKLQITEKPLSIEKLIPLKRQYIAIFYPQFHLSDFINNFIIAKKDEFKLNISTYKYSNNIVNSNQNIFKELQYIILILKENECCLRPPILDSLSKLYIKSKIFLIIENNNEENIKEKITFFKTYSKSVNIIDIYHSFNKESNQSIKEKIYNYLQMTQESNTLWKRDWIKVRDEIENRNLSNINSKDFISLAQKYSISQEIAKDLFIYLKKVGSIKDYVNNSSKKVLIHS